MRRGAEEIVRRRATSDPHLRCPVCGTGVLGDIAYDEQPSTERLKQDASSREVLTFSCGHEVEAGGLAEAARTDPNVERRQTDETVDPVEPAPDPPEPPMPSPDPPSPSPDPLPRPDPPRPDPAPAPPPPPDSEPPIRAAS
ncbi:MAG TPA: hypothetical protein VIC58_10000 [Actinomycetota bacterium]